jgi:hypothetical protein
MDKSIIWLVGEMEEIKWKIAAIGIPTLGALQVASWYFGKNGVVTALVTGSITAIVAYYFGKSKGSKAV